MAKRRRRSLVTEEMVDDVPRALTDRLHLPRSTSQMARLRVAIEARFPNLAHMGEHWRAQVFSLSTRQPPANVPRSHLPVIGAAVEYRLLAALGADALRIAGEGPRLIEFLDELAIHGVSFRRGGGRGQRRYYTREELSPGELARALRDERSSRYRPSASCEAAPPLVEQLARAVAEIKPAGRRLRADEEARLSRMCWMLAAANAWYHTGLDRDRLPPGLLAVVQARSRGHPDVTRVSLAEDEPAVADLAAVAEAFLDQDWPWGKPWWPKPSPGHFGSAIGTQPDLILDRCLIDFKTTIHPDRWDWRWGYQLLGYVVLGYSERYPLDAIGIYLTRQAKLIRWPLATWFPNLVGRSAKALRRLRYELEDVLAG